MAALARAAAALAQAAVAAQRAACASAPALLPIEASDHEPKQALEGAVLAAPAQAVLAAKLAVPAAKLAAAALELAAAANEVSAYGESAFALAVLNGYLAPQNGPHSTFLSTRVLQLPRGSPSTSYGHLTLKASRTFALNKASPAPFDASVAAGVARSQFSKLFLGSQFL